MPVESITGVPESRIASSSSLSVSEAEGILMQGVLNFLMKSTESGSQQETNQSIFWARQ